MKSILTGLALSLVAAFAVLRWVNNRPFSAAGNVSVTASQPPRIKSASARKAEAKPAGASAAPSQESTRSTPRDDGATQIQTPSRVWPAKPGKSQPRVEVELTGITKSLGKKRAFFVTATPGRRVSYYRLEEGEERGPLKVVAISVESSSVELLVNKEYRRLTFDLGDTGSGAPKGVLQQRRFDAEHQRIGDRDAREYERWQAEQLQAHMASAPGR